MKISIAVILFTMIVPSAEARLYKCVQANKIIYQDKPCASGKEIEFKLASDISVEKQEIARQKLADQLQQRHEQQRIAKAARQKERLVQAKEAQAKASLENAYQRKRKADALEQRNKIERHRRNRSVYFLHKPFQEGYPLVTVPRDKQLNHRRSKNRKSKQAEASLNIQIR